MARARDRQIRQRYAVDGSSTDGIVVYKVELMSGGVDALAVVEDRAGGPGFDLRIKLATSRLRGVCHCCGHRVRLSEDVHQTSQRACWLFAGSIRDRIPNIHTDLDASSDIEASVLE